MHGHLQHKIYLQHLSVTFLILRKIQRGTVINVHRSGQILTKHELFQQVF
jgi:hypothetical protein